MFAMVLLAYQASMCYGFKMGQNISFNSILIPCITLHSEVESKEI